MRQHVLIRFTPQRVLEITPSAAATEMPADEARRWLDAQFVALACETPRASGKVLTADKVMALARTVAPDRFTDDAGWAQAYARATLAALGRPLVTIDLHADAISY